MVAVLYINLDHRVDRRAFAENQLREYGLPAVRFPGTYNPESGRGCAESHLGALKYARDHSFDSTLILEDDFQFSIPKPDLHRLLSDLESMAFDVCMLSYNLHQSDSIDTNTNTNTNNDNFGRVLFAQDASAYLVKRHYYDTLIDLYSTTNALLDQTGRHWQYANDVVWRPLQQRDTWLYPTRRVGHQLQSLGSDNT